MDPDTLPSDYELSKEDVFGASDADSDDPSASSSSFDTEQDDPRPHEAITTPILHIYQTPHYQIPFLEVWPGDGAVPSAGDRLRVRWNIAKHMISLYDAEFGGYGRPWKGDWKAEGGSWKWPEDEAFEFVFRQDPRVAPGVEEVLASMRQGGRRHCLIKPKFGFTVQDGVVYDKPFPSDTHERTLLIKWLGKHFFDPKSLRQRQPLAWELDLELVERPRPGRPGQRTAFKLDASAQLEPS